MSEEQNKDLKAMKKADLVKLCRELEREMVRLMGELDHVQREFDKYKAQKSGQIGHGAIRNPLA